MSSDEGPRGTRKTWEGASYVMDPYMGMVHSQGGGSRKTGDEARADPGGSDAALLPKRSRKSSRPTTCQVDGCGRDLAGEKAYLQRYSVCEQHFKADVAVLHGLEVRFCQQCNKFQDLREFEGVRRSCAARSKDRNLRRRLQTSLQKGVNHEDLLPPGLAGLQHLQQQQRPGQRQQSGSQERSGGDGAGAGGPSDDSGGRAGSGDASMGGSAAAAQHPGRSGGSDGHSLDARAGAPTGTATAAEGLLAAQYPTGVLQSRNPAPASAHPQQIQTAGSSGNPGGASSTDVEFASHGGQRPVQHGHAALGVWASLEQVAQSYEPSPEIRLAGVQHAAGGVSRRNLAGAAATVGDGPAAAGTDGRAMMDIDALLGASGSSVYQQHQHRHGGHQQQGGGPQPGNAQGSGGLELPAQQDLSFARKFTGIGGGTGDGLGWGPPAAMSLLEGLEGLAQPQQQQPSLLSLRPASSLQLPQGKASPAGAGSWLAWAEQHQQQQQQQYPSQRHQHPEANARTLAGVTGEAGAAALLDQLQAAIGSRGRASGSPSNVGHTHGGEAAVQAMGEALDRSRRPPQLHLPQGHSQSPAAHALLSASSSSQQQQPDDLLAMVRDRRAALIRQQLLRQQHSQQQLPLLQHHQLQHSHQLQNQQAAQQHHHHHQQQQHQRQQPQQQQQYQHHQQHQDLLAQQEQLALLRGYGEGNFLGLSPSEQLQLRLIAAGASAGSSAAAPGLEDVFDRSLGPGTVAPGGMAVDVRGGGGSDALGARLAACSVAGAAAAAVAAGGAASLPPAEMLGFVRSQPAAPRDHNLEAIQLLEQYALGCGGVGAGGVGTGANCTPSLLNGAATNTHAAGAAACGLEGPLGSALAGGGTRAGGGQGLGSAANAAVGTGEGMGGHESSDMAGRLSVQGGSSDRGSGPASGGSRLLQGLFPGAGGVEDGLAARVCLKIFDCVPEYLPRDLLLRLRRWASVADSDVMQIFMRPGCVHIIVNMRNSFGGQAAVERSVLGDGDLDAAVAALRGAFDSCGLLRGRRVVAQAAERPKGAFEYDGTAGGQARWVAAEEFARAPSVESIWPAAMPCDTPTIAVLSGRNLLHPGTRYYARCGGRTFELHPLVPQPADSMLPAVTAAASVARGDFVGGLDTPAIAGAGEAGVDADAAAGPAGDAPTSTDSPPLLASPIHTASVSRVASCHQLAHSWASSESGPTPVTSPGTKGPAAPHGTFDADTAELSPPRRVSSVTQPPPQPLPPQPHPERQPPVQPPPSPAALPPIEHVYVHVPGLPQHGLLAVEAAHPDLAVMGSWAAGVACQDPAAAAELNAWLRRSADRFSGRFLLLETGLLLDYDSMLSSLLRGPGGAAFRASETGAAASAVAAGFPQSSAHVTAAGPGPAGAGTRGQQGTAQLGPQPLLSTQQEHLDYPAQQARHRVYVHGAVASNPVPRADPPYHDLVPPGALSAVTYSREDARPPPSIIATRPDGTLELRLLPSSSSERAAAAAAGDDSDRCPRGDVATGGGVPAVRPFGAPAGTCGAAAAPQHAAAAARRLHGDDAFVAPSTAATAAGVAVGVGVGRVPRPDDEARRREANEALLSDDTRVPDAAGRLLQPSLRRLLSHPLLNAACRRSLQHAAARLLAYAVASGLPRLSNGLLEWLMAVEMPALGLGAPPAAAGGGGGDEESETAPSAAFDAAALFSRVAHCAAATTGLAFIAGVGAGGADRGDAVTGDGAMVGSYVLSGRAPSSQDVNSSLSSSGSSLGGGQRFRELDAGLSLLALAVASGSSEMVLQALDWADAYGKPWAPEKQFGPGRVTALHLAAALRDCGDVARLLLAVGGSAAEEAWLLLRDARGRTPAEIAAAQGLTHLNLFCLYGEIPTEDPGAAVPSAGAGAVVTAAAAAAGAQSHAPPVLSGARAVAAEALPVAAAAARSGALDDGSSAALAGRGPHQRHPGCGILHEGSMRPAIAAAVLMAVVAVVMGLWMRSVIGRGP